MEKLNPIVQSFRRSLPGLIVIGLVELAAAYGFISLAIDRGSILWYLLALIFFVWAIKNLGKFIGKIIGKLTHA